MCSWLAIFAFWGSVWLQTTNSHVIEKRAAFYIANETMCIVDGEVYWNGDPVPTDDECERCTCRPPGFSCVLRDCETKPGCKAVRRVGECCPEYVCGCVHNNRVYEDGELIRDLQNNCYTCKCHGSSISCTFADCRFRGDCPPEYVQGECCPRYDHCPSTSTTAASTLEQGTDFVQQEIELVNLTSQHLGNFAEDDTTVTVIDISSAGDFTTSAYSDVGHDLFTVRFTLSDSKSASIFDYDTTRLSTLLPVQSVGYKEVTKYVEKLGLTTLKEEDSKVTESGFDASGSTTSTDEAQSALTHSEEWLPTGDDPDDKSAFPDVALTDTYPESAKTQEQTTFRVPLEGTTNGETSEETVTSSAVRTSDADLDLKQPTAASQAESSSRETGSSAWESEQPDPNESLTDSFDMVRGQPTTSERGELSESPTGQHFEDKRNTYQTFDKDGVTDSIFPTHQSPDSEEESVPLSSVTTTGEKFISESHFIDTYNKSKVSEIPEDVLILEYNVTETSTPASTDEQSQNTNEYTTDAGEKLSVDQGESVQSLTEVSAFDEDVMSASDSYISDSDTFAAHGLKNATASPEGVVNKGDGLTTDSSEAIITTERDDSSPETASEIKEENQTSSEIILTSDLSEDSDDSLATYDAEKNDMISPEDPENFKNLNHSTALTTVTEVEVFDPQSSTPVEIDSRDKESVSVGETDRPEPHTFEREATSAMFEEDSSRLIDPDSGTETDTTPCISAGTTPESASTTQDTAGEESSTATSRNETTIYQEESDQMQNAFSERDATVSTVVSSTVSDKYSTESLSSSITDEESFRTLSMTLKENSETESNRNVKPDVAESTAVGYERTTTQGSTLGIPDEFKEHATPDQGMESITAADDDTLDSRQIASISTSTPRNSEDLDQEASQFQTTNGPLVAAPDQGGRGNETENEDSHEKTDSEGEEAGSNATEKGAESYSVPALDILIPKKTDEEEEREAAANATGFPSEPDSTPTDATKFADGSSVSTYPEAIPGTTQRGTAINSTEGTLENKAEHSIATEEQTNEPLTATETTITTKTDAPAKIPDFEPPLANIFKQPVFKSTISPDTTSLHPYSPQEKVQGSVNAGKDTLALTLAEGSDYPSKPGDLDSEDSDETRIVVLHQEYTIPESEVDAIETFDAEEASPDDHPPENETPAPATENETSTENPTSEFSPTAGSHVIKHHSTTGEDPNYSDPGSKEGTTEKNNDRRTEGINLNPSNYFESVNRPTDGAEKIYHIIGLLGKDSDKVSSSVDDALPTAGLEGEVAEPLEAEAELEGEGEKSTFTSISEHSDTSASFPTAFSEEEEVYETALETSSKDHFNSSLEMTAAITDASTAQRGSSSESSGDPPTSEVGATASAERETENPTDSVFEDNDTDSDHKEDFDGGTVASEETEGDYDSSDGPKESSIDPTGETKTSVSDATLQVPDAATVNVLFGQFSPISNINDLIQKKHLSESNVEGSSVLLHHREETTTKFQTLEPEDDYSVADTHDYETEDAEESVEISHTYSTGSFSETDVDAASSTDHSGSLNLSESSTTGDSLTPATSDLSDSYFAIDSHNETDEAGVSVTGHSGDLGSPRLDTSTDSFTLTTSHETGDSYSKTDEAVSDSLGSSAASDSPALVDAEQPDIGTTTDSEDTIATPEESPTKEHALDEKLDASYSEEEHLKAGASGGTESGERSESIEYITVASGGAEADGESEQGTTKSHEDVDQVPTTTIQAGDEGKEPSVSFQSASQVLKGSDSTLHSPLTDKYLTSTAGTESSDESENDREETSAADDVSPTQPEKERQTSPESSSGSVTSHITSAGDVSEEVDETATATTDLNIAVERTELSSEVADSDSFHSTTDFSAPAGGMLPPLPILLKQFKANRTTSDEDGRETVGAEKISRLLDASVADEQRSENPREEDIAETGMVHPFHLSDVVSRVFKAPGYDAEYLSGTWRKTKSSDGGRDLRVKKDVGSDVYGGQLGSGKEQTGLSSSPSMKHGRQSHIQPDRLVSGIESEDRITNQPGSLIRSARDSEEGETHIGDSSENEDRALRK